MSYEPKVKDVFEKLLFLAHTAPDWETVNWIAGVGECFDGGDFDIEDFSNLRWRLDVLQRRVDVGDLVERCQAVLDTYRTRWRNECIHAGNLAMDIPPLKIGKRVGVTPYGL